MAKYTVGTVWISSIRMCTSMPDISASLRTHLLAFLGWGYASAVNFCSSGVWNFFLMGSRSFGKKKKVTYSSISTSDKSILTEQDFHVVQFIIANIFVFKHCFRNLMFKMLTTTKKFCSPASSSLVGILHIFAMLYTGLWPSENPSYVFSDESYWAVN